MLQSSYNYRERGMNTMLFTASLDDRYGIGRVASRIGLEADAHIYRADDNLLEMVEEAHANDTMSCTLVDVAQFLTRDQVYQLTDVADHLGIPVICYGLRTDFQGNLFPGSEALLAWADEMREVKTICHCGSKATMVVRMDEQGNPVKDGDQVAIGGNDRYVSMCRKHWKEALK
ncbi:thymidine kinase [Aestuariispira ectoiniformans]|uniref:thymidine kinase n=1 Tax=Aestuariispira ectoiniformans TaxID=2775080 RepID=UPI0035CD3655